MKRIQRSPCPTSARWMAVRSITRSSCLPQPLVSAVAARAPGISHLILTLASALYAGKKQHCCRCILRPVHTHVTLAERQVSSALIVPRRPVVRGVLHPEGFLVAIAPQPFPARTPRCRCERPASDAPNGRGEIKLQSPPLHLPIFVLLHAYHTTRDPSAARSCSTSVLQARDRVPQAQWPAACQVFMCMIRLLAEDESRADRAHRRIDLALLDAVTWPEFVWEWLRLVGGRADHECCSGAFSACGVMQHWRVSWNFQHRKHQQDAVGCTLCATFIECPLAVSAGDPLLACRWSGAGDAGTGEPHRRPSLWPPLGPWSPQPASPRGGGRLGREFHALPLAQKVSILDRLTGHLLDVHSVREVRRM